MFYVQQPCLYSIVSIRKSFKLFYSAHSAVWKNLLNNNCLYFSCEDAISTQVKAWDLLLWKYPTHFTTLWPSIASRKGKHIWNNTFAVSFHCLFKTNSKVRWKKTSKDWPVASSSSRLAASNDSPRDIVHCQQLLCSGCTLSDPSSLVSHISDS